MDLPLSKLVIDIPLLVAVNTVQYSIPKGLIGATRSLRPYQLILVSQWASQISLGGPKYPTCGSLASSPDLPRLLITASDLKEGRPGQFWYVTIRQVDTNVTSCQPTVTRLSYSVVLSASEPHSN